MKKILSTLFVTIFMITITSTVNAQTKADSDVKVVKSDVKPAPAATKALVAPKKVVRKSDATTVSQPVAPLPTTKSEAAAASPKKELKKVAVENAVATPVVKPDGPKNE